MKWFYIMTPEDCLKSVEAELSSLGIQHRKGLEEFRNALARAIEMFKSSGLEVKWYELELELVDRKLAELNSSEVI